jgi:hypothetical protein
MNVPKNSNVEGSTGYGFLYSYSSGKIFDKYKSISLQGGLQLSKFRTNTMSAERNEIAADIKTTEKLLTFDFGPRFQISEDFYIGFAITHNSFYEKLKGEFKWIDSSIGECSDSEVYYEDCEEDIIYGIIWDLGLSFAASTIGTISNEIIGYSTSTNRYIGSKINFGFIDNDGFSIEMSYSTMGALKRVLSSNDSSFLLDYISSDYFSINFSVPLK